MVIIISFQNELFYSGLACGDVCNSGRGRANATFHHGSGKPFFKSLQFAFGFTLIELLVVIAIIGILAALLLPVLSHGKRKAAEVVDINNMKQLTTAVHLYANDNRDLMPWSNWASGDAPDRPGWLYTMPESVMAGSSAFQVQTGLFWPILRNPKLYFCPLDGPNTPLFSARAQQISSYVMNGAVNGYNREDTDKTLLTKLGDMRPSGVVFWETDERHPDFFNDGASYPSEGVSQRHDKGAIYAAFDGSSGFVKFTDWYQQANSANKNKLWCYPGSLDGH
jgi:prepilin-type N-terminal cleavage/methylation domain-containing protein